MANRHQSRICVMQSLYELDLRPKAKLEEILARNIAEKEKSDLDKDYIKKTTLVIIKNNKKIDQLIGDSAPEWPLEQVARVDKNILRVAVQELVLTDSKTKVPPKVAIDEAVEIAKAFGGENSSKFVNGVLGTIYRKSKNEREKSKDKEGKIKNNKRELKIGDEKTKGKLLKKSAIAKKVSTNRFTDKSKAESEKTKI